MSRRSSHTSVFDPPKSRGSVAGQPPPAPSVSQAAIEIFGGPYPEPIFLAASLGFLITVTGPATLAPGDATLEGSSGGNLTAGDPYLVSPGVYAANATSFIEWATDIDLSVTNPPIDSFTTDGPHSTIYPYMAPGYVYATPNKAFRGVVVIDITTIAAIRQHDATHNAFVILDTTDRAHPTVISESIFLGLDSGLTVEYDAATERVYFGDEGSSSVFDISSRVSPTQGDAVASGTPRKIDSNLYITSDLFDDRIEIFDTTTLGSWTSIGGLIDHTDLLSPLDLLPIGGDQVLALVAGQISLIDVSTPSSPTVTALLTPGAVGASSFGGFVRDGSIVYIVGKDSPSTMAGQHVTALDVSVPASPTVISTLETTTFVNVGTHDPMCPRLIDGDLWVFGSQQTVVRVNVSNPAAMTIIDDVGAPYPSTTSSRTRDLVAAQADCAWTVSGFSTVIGIRTAAPTSTWFHDRVLSVCSPAHYWQMNDASSPIVDEGTLGDDLSGSGALTYLQPAMRGDLRESVAFGGTGMFVLPNDGITFSNIFNVWAWVQTTGTGEMIIAQQRDAAGFDGEWVLGTWGPFGSTPGHIYAWAYDGGSYRYVLASPAAINDGQPHLVGLTVYKVPSFSADLFIDGVSVDSVVGGTGPTFDAALDIVIGYDTRDGNKGWVGDISNVGTAEAPFNYGTWDYLYNGP